MFKYFKDIIKRFRSIKVQTIYMIFAALDYLPVSFYNFLYHIFSAFSFNTPKTYTKHSNMHRILGYSCRSLFDTMMQYHYHKNNNLTILTTPIHHTSFRNIIEKYVKPENVYILGVNDDYNKITEIHNYDVDLCIITHLFGQDMDCSFMIDNLNKFPIKTIFIEDRVQGGSFGSKFSCNFMDISLYSTGMDKKPCGLGGGVMYIKDNTARLSCIASVIVNEVKSYEQEYFWDRLLFLLKKIPTYILYNCKPFIKILIWVFKKFNLDLHKFATKYRKKNPGFQHANYNKNPSNGTLHSINYALQKDNYTSIEKLYIEKSLYFFSKLKCPETKKRMFKWYNEKPLLTPYNSVYLNNRPKFIAYLNNLKIPVLENPTYKIFNFDHIDKNKYQKFNDSIVYLPSLAILTKKEISDLASLLITYIE